MAKNKSASRNSVSSTGNFPKNNSKKHQRTDKRKETCVNFTNELCDNVSFCNNINSETNYDSNKQPSDFNVAKMKIRDSKLIENSKLNSKIKEVIHEDRQVFDKRKWRAQKYSRKYKVEQWEERRKKVVLREFYKGIKHDKPGIDVAKIYAEGGSSASGKLTTSKYSEEDNNPNVQLQRGSADDQMTTKGKYFRKAHLEFQKIRQEKRKSQEETEKKREARVEARNLREKERFGKRKKLNKKTKTGQPVMKGRLELLLEQIQRET